MPEHFDAGARALDYIQNQRQPSLELKRRHEEVVGLARVTLRERGAYALTLRTGDEALVIQGTEPLMIGGHKIALRNEETANADRIYMVDVKGRSRREYLRSLSGALAVFQTARVDIANIPEVDVSHLDALETILGTIYEEIEPVESTHRISGIHRFGGPMIQHDKIVNLRQDTEASRYLLYRKV
jgi:hypothetical protein